MKNEITIDGMKYVRAGSQADKRQGEVLEVIRVSPVYEQDKSYVQLSLIKYVGNCANVALPDGFHFIGIPSQSFKPGMKIRIEVVE